MKGHRKKIAYMNQPAEGWYADCSCGYRGALRYTKEEANQEFQDHLPKKVGREAKT